MHSEAGKAELQKPPLLREGEIDFDKLNAPESKEKIWKIVRILIKERLTKVNFQIDEVDEDILERCLQQTYVFDNAREAISFIEELRGNTNKLSVFAKSLIPSAFGGFCNFYEGTETKGFRLALVVNVHGLFTGSLGKTLLHELSHIADQFALVLIALKLNRLQEVKDQRQSHQMDMEKVTEELELLNKQLNLVSDNVLDTENTEKKLSPREQLLNVANLLGSLLVGNIMLSLELGPNDWWQFHALFMTLLALAYVSMDGANYLRRPEEIRARATEKRFEEKNRSIRKMFLGR